MCSSDLVKELKKYEKISLNPGEEKIVEFEIDVNDLKFYDDIKEQWRAEAGKFKAYIGASSTDIKTVSDFILE